MAFALGKACSQVVTLLSVMAIALGKVTENSLFLFVFYIPSKQIEDIYNKHHIYIINSIDIQHHIYITNITCLTIYHK